jgi:acyl carrier protein
MDNNEVRQRVIKIFCEVLNLNESEVQLDVAIRDAYQLDSLKQMSLFIALEDEFQRTIPPERVTGLVTVQDVIDFVIKELQEPTHA